jgi:hypothetical protein
MHGLESASLLRREPTDVCYKTAPNQPHMRDGVIRSAKRPGRDHRRSGADEARDAVDTRGLNGLGEGHRRQHGGQPARSHGLAGAGTVGGMSLTGACDALLPVGCDP